MLDLLVQWTFAAFVFVVSATFIWSMVKLDERRKARMTQEERDQEWLDMQW